MDAIKTAKKITHNEVIQGVVLILAIGFTISGILANVMSIKINSAVLREKKK